MCLFVLDEQKFALSIGKTKVVIGKINATAKK